MDLITPEIKTLVEKKLVGQRFNTTLAENRTPELWRSFMPWRKDVKNTLGSDLYSLKVFEASFDINDFDLHTSFNQWAAVEVSDFAEVPKGMETLVLAGGQYAVFQYKGIPAAAEPFFRYIYFEWLPASGYVLDNRPHFEILGEKYKNNHPDSEEEIWIPVK